MKTDADDHISLAKEGIDSAIEHLSEVVIRKCSGHNDYRPEYKSKYKKALIELLDLRENLE